MFDHTLLRIIHHIVKLHTWKSDKISWLQKEDFEYAYRWVYTNSRTETKSAVRLKIKGEWFILVSLRLPFGGSPCPPDLCLASDIITDTTKNLCTLKERNHKEVCSDYVKNIHQAKKRSRDILFCQAQDLSINLPVGDSGKVDYFVDNIISCTVDIDVNL